MRLRVLLDNNTYVDEYYLGEPGVSYLIEDEGTNILMDTGYSGVFLANAKKLGEDLNSLNAVVLSHGHNDHTGGLNLFFENVDAGKISVITHPQAFDRKYYDGKEIGSPLLRTEIASKCRLVQSQTPLRLSKNITWLGEIPRIMDFEKPRAIGETMVNGRWGPDFLRDDSALVFEGGQGIYIITGCSHSGICNITEYARKVTGVSKVIGLIGGFHLFNEKSHRTRETIAYLKELDIPQLYPCHCTSFAVRAALHQETPIKEVGVGLELEWN